MSRVAKRPVPVPGGVEIRIEGRAVTVKGAKGALSLALHPDVELVREEASIGVRTRSAARAVMAMAGTTRALLANMVTGVSTGFERRLQLVGVGYRAQMKGSDLSLSLGFSHPVSYAVPEGITVETPSQTEVVIRGIDKQRVGQVAADIRAIRPPEPYKGKGVRYADERVSLKEAKKK